jgi:hypothetical protein
MLIGDRHQRARLLQVLDILECRDPLTLSCTFSFQGEKLFGRSRGRNQPLFAADKAGTFVELERRTLDAQA